MSTVPVEVQSRRARRARIRRAWPRREFQLSRSNRSRPWRGLARTRGHGRAGCNSRMSDSVSWCRLGWVGPRRTELALAGVRIGWTEGEALFLQHVVRPAHRLQVAVRGRPAVGVAVV